MAWIRACGGGSSNKKYLIENGLLKGLTLSASNKSGVYDGNGSIPTITQTIDKITASKTLTGSWATSVGSVFFSEPIVFDGATKISIECTLENAPTHRRLAFLLTPNNPNYVYGHNASLEKIYTKGEKDIYSLIPPQGTYYVVLLEIEDYGSVSSLDIFNVWLEKVVN